MFGEKCKSQGLFGTLKINSNTINDNNQFKISFNETKSNITSKNKSSIFKDLSNKRNNTNSLTKQEEKCNHKNFLFHIVLRRKKIVG